MLKQFPLGRVLSIIPMLVSLFGWVSLAQGIGENLRYLSAEKAQGTVIQIQEELYYDDDNREQTTFRPLISWTDARGEQHRYWSKYASSPSPKIGQTYVVEYLDGDPATAREVRFSTKWHQIIFGISFGSAFLITGIIIWRLNPPKNRSDDSG